MYWVTFPQALTLLQVDSLIPPPSLLLVTRSLKLPWKFGRFYIFFSPICSTKRPFYLLCKSKGALQKKNEHAVVFISLISIHKFSLLFFFFSPLSHGDSEQAAVQVLSCRPGSMHHKGEAALGCGSGAGEGRCHTGKLSSSASDSSRVRQESEMQCPCHNSCIIKNTMHRQTTDPGYSPGETHLQENSKTTWFKQTFQCHAEHQHTRSYLEQCSFWESQTNWTSKLEIQEKGSRKRESN